MTQAERIAALFHDGYDWDFHGSSLEDLCLRQGALVDHDGDSRMADTLTKYTFDDGSSIVTASAAWDLGIDGADCFCWDGAGHEEDCNQRELEYRGGLRRYFDDHPLPERVKNMLYLAKTDLDSFDEQYPDFDAAIAEISEALCFVSAICIFPEDDSWGESVEGREGHPFYHLSRYEVIRWIAGTELADYLWEHGS